MQRLGNEGIQVNQIRGAWVAGTLQSAPAAGEAGELVFPVGVRATPEVDRLRSPSRPPVVMEAWDLALDLVGETGGSQR